MRLWFALGVVALSVGLYAGQQDPAHPWPNHEPPPDYICVPAMNEHDVQTDVHACSCLGMMDPICGSDDENHANVNSGKCKSWCKPDQCTCIAQCKNS